MNQEGMRRDSTGATTGYRPIILVGAARSGTNMLRDLLVQLPGFGTWPCDEINYIWRHGNATYPSDEFPPELATASAKKYIRDAFSRLAQSHGLRDVVEKTTANSLRVGFVDRIFPDARYVFIVRDGRDVVASAMKRWRAPLDLPYILRKARFVPASDVPLYASAYFYNRVHRLFSKRRQLSTWGPRFDGMRDRLQDSSLEIVCASQWLRCVERTEADLAQIDGDRVHRLRYEDLVSSPSTELAKLLDFLKVPTTDQEIAKIAQGVFVQSVGKWGQELSSSTVAGVSAILKNSLRRYGYEVG